MNAPLLISRTGGLARAGGTLISWVMLATFCLSLGQLHALITDLRGVQFVTVQVMASAGEPLKGVTAVVRVPPQEGEEEFFATLGIAKQAGSWTALQQRGFATDVFGMATVPYITGGADGDLNPQGKMISLPHEIVISAKGYVTQRLKFKERAFFRSHLHLPFFEVALTPLKKDEAPREEERVFSFKPAPIPEK